MAFKQRMFQHPSGGSCASEKGERDWWATVVWRALIYKGNANDIPDDISENYHDLGDIPKRTKRSVKDEYRAGEPQC